MGDLFDLSHEGLMGFGVQGSSRKTFSPNSRSLKSISQSVFAADADQCLSQERGRKKKKKTESIVGNPERREGWEVGVRVPESLLRILGLRVSFGKRPGGKRLA